MMPAYADAHVMRNAVITINAVEYANQCTKARFVPDTPIQTLRTLVPDGTVQDVDSPTWTLELAGVQSHKTGGLAKALTDAAVVGDPISVTVQPKAGTGEDTATATIIPVAVEFGGEQGQFRTMDIVLPVVGSPTFGTSV